MRADENSEERISESVRYQQSNRDKWDQGGGDQFLDDPKFGMIMRFFSR